MKILVTGASGYIGSHTCLELLNSDFEVLAVDNLSNSKQESLVRVQDITKKKLNFIQTDLLEYQDLSKIFLKYKIDAVIHFAGHKSVAESVINPLKYLHNNVVSTINLCHLMDLHKIKYLVFSSSATVYGQPDRVPIKEDDKLSPNNPYGQSKLTIENFLRNLYSLDDGWNISILRYFNPVGAHQSGSIGEDPKGIPNNLMPYISRVAVGSLDKLKIYGKDYETTDGTGVRDYIHVVDLAKGHVAALLNLFENSQLKNKLSTLNLGTGRGYSVLEVVKAFEEVSGETIPFEIVNRRQGDIAESYADTSRVNKLLAWKAELSLKQMCRDSWNWQKKFPKGY